MALDEERGIGPEDDHGPEDDAREDGAELAGDEAIGLALHGIISLAANGIEPNDFLRYLGLDPYAVRRYAHEAAEEEFRTLPGLPPGIDATGRLRKLSLSANQRAEVKEALEEVALVALQLGAVLTNAKRRGSAASQEGASNE